ncbi:hypothetical protein DESC_350084 [Desulfosarcina cetonica]|nr:hypothetical protein DESC_350084 [Desulfosarcina cetonica]
MELDADLDDVAEHLEKAGIPADTRAEPQAPSAQESAA